MTGGILAVPGCEEKVVGDVSVLWLRRDVLISEAALQATVDPAEWHEASGMRAIARRQEYLRARWLIRLSTGWHGPLPRTPRGGPSWPPGRRGSLSHKDGDVVVSLSEDPQVLALGIDLEDLARVKEGFEPRLCNAAESELLTAVAAATGRPRVDWLGALFSFKEALFKCHHPLGGRMFYFHDAVVTAIEGDKIAAKVLLETTPLTPAGASVTGHVLFFANPRDEGKTAPRPDWVLTSVTQRPPPSV